MVSFPGGCGRFDKWPFTRDFDAIRKELHGTVTADVHISVLALGAIQTTKGKRLQKRKTMVRISADSSNRSPHPRQRRTSRGTGMLQFKTEREQTLKQVRTLLKQETKRCVELRCNAYPMFTPSMLARNLDVNQSADPPFVV